MDDSLILKPEALFKTDIRYSADLLETIFEGQLRAPPAGIYISGKLEPAMVDGKEYHYKNGTESVVFTDINVVEKAVYDENYKCVIPAYCMKNRSKLVSNLPFLPYRGLKIMFLLIQQKIDNFVQYRSARIRRDYDRLLGDQFNEATALDGKMGQQLDDASVDVIREIDSWLGNHDWNLYFPKLKDTNVIIERCIDYRAYCWERENGELFRSGAYTGP